METIVSLTIKIIIYIAIGAPGNDKDVVNGLNTTYKIYWRG